MWELHAKPLVRSQGYWKFAASSRLQQHLSRTQYKPKQPDTPYSIHPLAIAVAKIVSVLLSQGILMGHSGAILPALCHLKNSLMIIKNIGIRYFITHLCEERSHRLW